MSNNAAIDMQKFCEAQNYRMRDGLVWSNALGLPDAKSARQLIWSSYKPNDWEILVYKEGESWEACFFRWPIHHEHVNGPSFAFVRQRVEQKICVLEAAGLKTAEWRQTIDCDVTPGSGILK